MCKDNSALGERMCVPVPVSVCSDGGNTIVEWEDGSRSVLRTVYTDMWDPFITFCVAYTQKAFGGPSPARAFFRSLCEPFFRKKRV